MYSGHVALGTTRQIELFGLVWDDLLIDTSCLRVLVT